MDTHSPSLTITRPDNGFSRAILLLLILMVGWPLLVTFQADGFPLGISAVLVAGLLGLWLSRQYVLPRSTVLLLVGTMMLYLLVQSILSTRLFYLTAIAFGWWLMLVLTMFVFSSWAKLKNLINILGHILLISQFILALSAIVMMIINQQRATGWLYNANGLGAALLWGLFLSASWLIAEGRRRRWWVIYFVILAAWLLTISLTSFVAALFPLSWLLWTGRARLAWKKIGLVFLTVCVIGAGALFGFNRARHQPLMTAPHISFSFTQRWEFNLAAVRMWQAKPWFGWGLGTYKQTMPRFTNQIDEQPLYTHNLYTQLLAETGVVGALGWIVIVILIGRAGWQTLRSSRSEPHYAILRGLFFGWLAFTIAAGLDFGWFFPAGAIWWFVAAGIFIGLATTKTIQVSRRLSAGPTILMAGLLLFIAGAVIQAKTLSDRAIGKYGQSDLSGTIEPARSAVRLTMNPEDVTLLAQTLWLRRQGDDITQAETILRQALNKNPDNYFLHQQLATTLNTLDRPAEALSEFALTHQLDPYFHPRFTINYAIALDRAGQQNQALKIVSDTLAFYETRRTINLLILQEIENFRKLKQQLEAGPLPR